MTLRAAIYARVSSSAQRDAHTIESQLYVLRPFAKREGWEVVGEYIDDGRSAKTGQLERRDGFARLVRDATAGRFDILAVVDINRLTRTEDMRERAEILGPFQAAGIRIVTPTGGELDLRTMLGELYVTLHAIVAAEENRKRTEAIKRGKARAIAEGRKPAGPTPYGLAYDRASGQWSIDSVRGPIVAEIYRRVIAGESCQSIAIDLHDRGVPRPRSSQWTRHFVWRIVRQRYPVGEWSPDKASRAVIRVPAIVDEATWQLAQEALIEHGKRGLVRVQHVYLLQGLGVCGHCGEPIAIRSANHRAKTRAAYVCRARKLDRRYAGRCTSAILPADEVDARVWTIVSRALASPELAAAVERRAAERAANRRDWQADVRRYEARLEQIERATTALTARFRRGLITEAVLDHELAAAARDRAAISAQLETARRAAGAHDEPVGSVDEWLAALRSLAATAQTKDRRRVVTALVRRGAAVFVGGAVEIDLEIDEPQGAGGATPVSVVSAGYRTQHGTITRKPITIRLVA
jgi:site-specific DNA recombinase